METNFPNLKRIKTNETLQYDEFTNLPKDIKNEIFKTLLNNLKTKEEALCQGKFLTSSKSFYTNLLLYKQIASKLPTVIEYQQSSIYLKENKNDLPPYLITCKDICQNINNCITDVTRIETIVGSFDSFRDFLDFVKDEDEDNKPKKIFDEIIWNCPCIHVELCILSKKFRTYGIGTFYEQRIWIKEDGKPWTEFELFHKISEFYESNFTIEEVNSIKKIIDKDIENKKYPEYFIKTYDSFIKELSLNNKKYYSVFAEIELVEYNGNLVWRIY